MQRRLKEMRPDYLIQQREIAQKKLKKYMYIKSTKISLN